MYPHLIEVHLADDDCAVTLNIDHILGISDTNNNGAGYVIKTSDKGGWYVRETYDEIKALLRDSGCHIQKRDPRLELTKALTIDDLKDMIGEPVWNSNNGQWYLVESYKPDDTLPLILIQAADVHIECFTEKDLIAKPLYRMKVQNESIRETTDVRRDEL